MQLKHECNSFAIRCSDKTRTAENRRVKVLRMEFLFQWVMHFRQMKVEVIYLRLVCTLIQKEEKERKIRKRRWRKKGRKRSAIYYVMNWKDFEKRWERKRNSSLLMVWTGRKKKERRKEEGMSCLTSTIRFPVSSVRFLLLIRTLERNPEWCRMKRN